MFPREDYRKLTELIFVYLGGQLPVNKFYLWLVQCTPHGLRQNLSICWKGVTIWVHQFERWRMASNQHDRFYLYDIYLFNTWSDPVWSWIAVFSLSDDRKFIGSMISYREEKTNMTSSCRLNFYQASIKLFNWGDRRTFNF